MGPHIIEIQGLKKSFHGHAVLRGVELAVASSQLTVLIGPSGCGKSTLLRCLNGLEVFDEGRISVNGLSLRREPGLAPLNREYHQVTHALRGMMGMVFQSFNLFPHMTTLDNVARPPPSCAASRWPRRGTRLSACSKKWGSGIRRCSTLPSFPGVSSSALRSPGPWR